MASLNGPDGNEIARLGVLSLPGQMEAALPHLLTTAAHMAAIKVRHAADRAQHTR